MEKGGFVANALNLFYDLQNAFQRVEELVTHAESKLRDSFFLCLQLRELSYIRDVAASKDLTLLLLED